ncbi:hypothetical protein MKQ68_01935 [Chitinophaga horti]|uniref:Long-chain fatty acid transport protein n=1 Tax=Chitinophaga horti TaxID=2920382 RepID=A0ABY6J6E1_9BACT|nr:hypothetical protein [Chitinophaga horti]UYQ93854.1 hypothetical protein MKQ68_01935 [Chitinophaga horti]
MQNKLYLTIYFLLLASLHASAQKGINSLYSAYGIGDLEERDYSRNFGVGSAGIGRRTGNFLNEQNPASYSALPNQRFFFEVSGAAKMVQYSTTSYTQNAGDINFKKIAMGFKAGRIWGMSFGVTPFSSIDYKVLNTKYITGTPTGVRSAIEGSGGLTRTYFSNAVQLGKHFSVGLSGAFLFGNVTTTDSTGGTGQRADVFTENVRGLHNFNLTSGLQYMGRVGNMQLGAGLTYRLQTKLKSDQTFTIKDNSDNTFFEDDVNTKHYIIPAQYGAGLSLTNGRFTALADYRMSDWTGKNTNLDDYVYTKSHRVAGGLEYSFYKYYLSNRVEGVSIQLGANYQTSYIKVKGQDIRDFGITAGVSLPAGNTLRYYVGLEVGQRGTQNKGLIQENFANIVFSLSMRDLWFFKRVEY